VPKENLCAAQGVVENTSRPRNPFGMKPLDEFSAMTAHRVRSTAELSGNRRRREKGRTFRFAFYVPASRKPRLDDFLLNVFYQRQNYIFLKMGCQEISERFLKAKKTRNL
jgi:hypothetical protein